MQSIPRTDEELRPRQRRPPGGEARTVPSPYRPRGQETDLRLVIHDHCDHLGQVHLSRQLARRGHQVEHQFCVSYTTGRGAIQLRDGDPESLLMIGESCITDRHYFDCSGHVILRPFSTFGGLKSIVQSHELDFADNKTEPGRIVLGGNAVTTAGCILLKDSYLPERSVLAAGSVLPRARRALTCRPPGFTAGPGAFHSRDLGI